MSNRSGRSCSSMYASWECSRLSTDPRVEMDVYPPTGYWSSSRMRVGTSRRPGSGRTGRAGSRRSRRAAAWRTCRWATYSPMSARAVPLLEGDDVLRAEHLRRPPGRPSPRPRRNRPEAGAGRRRVRPSQACESTSSGFSARSPRITAGESSAPPTPSALADLPDDVRQAARPVLLDVPPQGVAGPLERPVGVQLAEDVVLVGPAQRRRPAGNVQGFLDAVFGSRTRGRRARRPRRTRRAAAAGRRRRSPEPMRGPGGRSPPSAAPPAGARAPRPRTAGPCPGRGFRPRP